MVDSIEIIAEDIRGVHRHIFDTLLSIEGGWSKEEGKINLNDLRSVPNNLRFEYFVDHATDGLKANLYGKPFYLPSSHYQVACFIDPEKEEVRFNFSIPKYLHGTNVLQFILSPYHNKFRFAQASSWEFQIAAIYPHLKRFIDAFFDENFISVEKIDFTRVRINRIDLCFNQIFDSKREKDAYLSMQRMKKKKHFHEGSGKMMYDGTVMFKTESYSAKIYDKEKEFRKKDLKKLRDVFEHDKILSVALLASRTLRYEITFRSRKINELYSKHVFRKNSARHAKRVELYKQLRAQISRAERGTDEPLDKADQKIYKHMTALLTKQRKFYLELDPYYQQLNTITPEDDDPKEHFCAKFDRELCKVLGTYFQKFFDEFQLDERPKLAKILEKEDEYDKKAKIRNETLKGQLEEKLISEEDYKRLRMPRFGTSFKLYASLKTRNEFDDDIRAENLFSRATFYRLKKHYSEDLGFSDNFILEDSIIPPKDFSAYYSALTFDYPEILCEG